MASRFPLRLVGLLFALLPVALMHAQRPAEVVMLSDIHFDPFHDPARVQQLRSEPIEHWPEILDAPAAATQAADLQALQTACSMRSLDTAWPLLKTALTAAHQSEPHPAFVTLSGDLLTHEFTCRFQHTAPEASSQDLSSFAAKTVAFVLAQTRNTFPHTPLYSALGNNDSGCADYRETPADAFSKNTSTALAASAGLNPSSLSPEGDYSVLLPAPMQHTRLIVLQDTFEARQFTTCGGSGAKDRSPELAQLDWLRKELTAAHAHGEQVWVMAHMPPGVDVYASFRRYVFQPAALCSAEPRPFLADTGLVDALLDHADSVRLAIFGHTHMDEFRLLHRAAAAASAGVSGSPSPAIPAKIVPSVTPFFGNHPAFVLVTVDPKTAIVKDWRTVVSPSPTGSAPPWVESYRYTSAYHEPDFSAASAVKLAQAFTADPTGQTPVSSTFRQHFFAGDIGLYALGLAQIWPAYACAIREDHPSAVHSCICASLPAEKKEPSPQ